MENNLSDKLNIIKPNFIYTSNTSIDCTFNAIPIVKIFGSLVTTIGKEATKRKVWSCCGESKGSDGCESMREFRWRYTCCHKDIDNGGPGFVIGVGEIAMAAGMRNTNLMCNFNNNNTDRMLIYKISILFIN